MTMRSTWKGHVRMGLLSVAVKVYNGVDSAEGGIALKNVHAGCGGHVGKKDYCKKCNKDVTKDGIVKGYEVAKDQFTIFKPEEIDSIKSNLRGTKIIDLVKFVPADQIPITHYETPYLMSPDGAIGYETYALIRDAMIETGKVFVGKVVFRDRENVAVISPLDGGLALYVVRFQNEVRKMSDVPGIEQVAERTTAKGLLDIAVELVNKSSADYETLGMQDTYVEQMKALIDAKIAGKDFTVPDASVAAPSTNVMDALKASLAAMNASPTTSAPVKSKAAKPAKAKKVAKAS